MKLTKQIFVALATISIVVAAPASSSGSHRSDISGCVKKHDSGYHDVDNAHSIQSGGKTRFYGIYVPKGYSDDPHKQRKVIFDYHGNGGSSKGQYNNSMYYKYPEGAEYLAVYPLGWNDTGDPYWQGAPYPGIDKTINDLQFTTDLLAHVRENYCVDSNRVYASGKSLGGGFVDLLACSDNGDEFAAFAMASAALYVDNSLSTCSKHRAILESHGEIDTTISYHGGDRRGGQLPDIPTWIDWWGQRDGCSTKDRVTSDDSGGYKTISYSCNGRKDVVQHYDVFKLGHCWPSSTGDNSDGSRSYCTDHSLDYTPVVLDFFNKWCLGDKW